MALETKSSVAVAANAIVLGPFDVNLSTAYGLSANQFTVQVDALGGGVTIENSNDGATWYVLQAIAAVGILTVNVGARFVRVRATGAGTPIIAGRLANSSVPAAASAGSGGGAATIADGADIAEGSRADALATNSTGSWSVIALLKGIWQQVVNRIGTGLNNATIVEGKAVTVVSTITRPANTTAYTANTALAAATAAVGGSTLSGITQAAGRSCLLTDVIVASNADPATTLVGEVWVFDQALSAVPADAAAFALAVADRLNLVAVIPFTLATVNAGSGASGSVAHISGLMFTCTSVGTPDLRFVVKVKLAYTPISGEVISVKAKVIQPN